MKPRDVKTSEGEPHDRLTRLGDEVLNALVAHRQYTPGMKAMVFIHDDDRSGIAIHGYQHDEEIEPLIDLFIHLQAMFAAVGKELSLLPIPNKPEFS